VASSVPAAIRKPLGAFTRAIASGDVGLLRGAYPGLSGDQEKRWTTFFAQSEKIKVVSVGYGKPVIKGNVADVDFTVGVSYDLRSSKTPMTSILQNHATLEKQGTGWQIKAITSP
jgi:hypothetical protein